MTDGVTAAAVEKEVQKRRSAIAPVNSRIAALRRESVEAQVSVCGERARLITEFYRQGTLVGVPVPVQRAIAFRYLMEHVSIPVEEGQLIVGLRGTGPQRVPTYPEICVHSPE
ncbi:MAG: pyruvate formate lyase family protein, partial [Bacillota bacterium]